MNIRRNRILVVTMASAVLSLNAIVAQQVHADSVIPKPEGLYQGYTATLLPDGKWLVAGGIKRQRSGFGLGPDGKSLWGSGNPTDEAILSDPATGNWTNTGAMTSKRSWHTATLLANAKVLVVGGEAEHGDMSSAEIYDPVTGLWTRTGSLNNPRRAHAATLLANGRVLVAGGVASRTNYPHTVSFATAELYDPGTEKWTMTSPMSVPRGGHTATLLTNGVVLVAGGKDQNANFLFSAELYDPATGKWTMTGSMTYEARFHYTANLLTNGQVLLTATGGNYAWELTNAWAAGMELYDPAGGQWTAIGSPRPHSVSSTNLDRTLTILPESGTSFLASQEACFLIESADRFGVTNIQIFRDNLKIAEGEDSPMRYILTHQPAGTFSFLAKATYANGLASTSSPVSITFKASGPQVFLSPGPTEFISERHVKSSPAVLLATVVGVNPDSLTKLTLNGVAQPLQTGNFVLRPPPSEGKNVFVLAATDKQGRNAKGTTEIYLDTNVPTVSINEPANNASINAACVDVHGTFAAKNLKQITVSQMPAAVDGNTFEVLHVFLQPGTNVITAVAEDIAGNLSTNTINVMGPNDTNVARVLPIEIQAIPGGGFVPLPVTFNPNSEVEQ